MCNSMEINFFEAKLKATVQTIDFNFTMSYH